MTMRKTIRRLLAHAALGFALVACHKDVLVPTRDKGAPVQTDATTYVLVRDGVGWRTSIAFEFRNIALDTLYIVNCDRATQVALEQQGGGSWSTFWSPVVQLCLSSPIVIPPGATYTDTLSVWGAEPGHNVIPEFPSTDLDGVYRVVWNNVVLHYGTGPQGFGTPAPMQFRYSNAFRLLRAN